MREFESQNRWPNQALQRTRRLRLSFGHEFSVLLSARTPGR